MAADDEQAAWVARVIGIDVGALASGKPGVRARLLPLWTDAKETVDVAIEQLQRALLGHGHPDLQRIAEFGLNGVTDRNSVGLMAALHDHDSSGGAAPARAKLAKAVAGFRTFLEGDQIVDLIEENPFGIAVALRRTLRPALDTIDDALAA